MIRRLLLVATFLSALSLPAVASTTWNPVDKDASITLGSLIGSSNLTATSTVNDSWRAVRGNSISPKISGKWYYEVQLMQQDGNAGITIGVGNATASLSAQVGSSVNSCGFDSGSSISCSGGTPSVNSCNYLTNGVNYVGIAVDLDHNKFWCTIDGISWDDNPGVDNPSTNTGGTTFNVALNDGISVMPMVSLEQRFGGTDEVALITGSMAQFRFTIPSGFGGWDANGTDAGSNSVTAATWDPANNGGGVTFTNGNLTVTRASGSNAYRTTLSTDLKYTGKLYYEIHIDSTNGIGNGYIQPGIASQWTGTSLLNQLIGLPSGIVNSVSYNLNYFLFDNQGNVCGNTGWATGTYLGIAIDIPNGRIWCTQDGTNWNDGTGSPTAGTDFISVKTIRTIGVYATVIEFGDGSTDTATLNVSGPYHFTIPTGFCGWDGSCVGVGTFGGLLLRNVGQ